MWERGPGDRVRSPTVREGRLERGQVSDEVSTTCGSGWVITASWAVARLRALLSASAVRLTDCIDRNTIPTDKTGGLFHSSAARIRRLRRSTLRKGSAFPVPFS